MRSAFYRILFGSVAHIEQERDSARAENLQLHARLQALADEREDLRKRVEKLQDELILFTKQAIDGMVVNDGKLPWFGVGPKLPEPPKVDFEPVARRLNDEAKRKNEQFLKETRLKYASAWTENGDTPAPPEE